MKHMSKVGIRALKQNASAVVADAAAGATVTITVRGQSVAQIAPIPTSTLQQMLNSGRARPALRDIKDLPTPEPGPDLSAELQAMRDSEQY